MARSGFYKRGKATTPDGPPKEWVPKVDKNSFYRINDINNSKFRKNFKLLPATGGSPSRTDCNSVIFVNFNEKAFSKVAEDLGSIDGKTKYKLDCDHIFEGKTLYHIGKAIPCSVCGGDGAFLSFRHEWCHIIFHSDPILITKFIDTYYDQEIKGKYDVDERACKDFLFLFANIHDDIRVNSLQEKVYPGAAHDTWARWKRLTARADYDNNFLALIMAIGADMPISDKGPFAGAAPAIEWSTKRVRYKGSGNFLKILRVAIDKTIGAILSNVPPKPPQSPAPNIDPPTPQDPNDSGSDSGNSDDSGDSSVSSGGAGNGSSSSNNPPLPPPPDHIPSPKDVNSTQQQRNDALDKLLKKAKSPEFSDHHKPSGDEISKDNSSITNNAAIVAAMNTNSSDVTSVDSSISGGIDTDVQNSINLAKSTPSQASKTSMLVDGAKADLILIKVHPYEVGGAINLDPAEKFAVDRMHAAFIKVMGKVRTKIDEEGMNIDTQAAIQQLLGASEDGAIFETELLNQGFCYTIVSDMSGSMKGQPFDLVCRAVEMLKRALDFPFVDGELWGFRGGKFGTGEVIMYQYDKECKGYAGASYVPQLKSTVGVECGGITPMNTAINVATKAIMQKPVGMAKRMFLLTDGSPLQTKTTGVTLPDHILRQFVKEEILKARKKGIQVYTLLIGHTSIPDEHCYYMFGPQQFWRRVANHKGNENSVDLVLQRLVIENFTRYMKARA